MGYSSGSSPKTCNGLSRLLLWSPVQAVGLPGCDCLGGSGDRLVKELSPLVYSRVLWSGCWRLLGCICLWCFISGPRGIAPRQWIRYTGRYWAWRRIKSLAPCRVFISIASMGMRLRLSSGRTLTPEPTLGSRVWWRGLATDRGGGSKPFQGIGSFWSLTLPISPMWPVLSTTRLICSGWRRRSLGWGASLLWTSSGQVLPMGRLYRRK
jgi:hypothetical protein